MSVNPSIYRSERRWMQLTREKLRRERFLRCHVALIAVCTLAALLLGGALLRWAGVEALAWRYALLLPMTYLVYLGLLRLWASYLLHRDKDSYDGADIAADMLLQSQDGCAPRSAFESGGGGDFGGGGASADFSADFKDVAADSAGEFASGAAKLGGEVLGGLDEGAVVVVPLAAMLAIFALLAGLLSAAVLMLFGVEVLLLVCVEVALSAWMGGLAYRQQREGWLGRAFSHTWRGALAVMLLGLALGAAIDHFLPAADSLPQALTILRGKT
ncbi:hypothetical protein [Roseateles albus]|uniref:Transmembrane protein n=1 Tax=Roseateles albus TaxID=2987525 RepID=A0ABT5KNL3_9BURK|nr:hypothetical protein [Roseateles albus]MDC8774495.1 hypothetical protein [Roseateles albus]